MRGRILVLEGIDKSGKTTQAKLLETRFLDQGLNPVILSFPNYENNTGKVIRYMISDPDQYPRQFFHIMVSANRWEDVRKIEHYLSEGYIIILNRYSQSNLIYGSCNGFEINWLKKLDEGLPKEDIVIVLDSNYETISKRQVDEKYHITDDPKLVDKVAQRYRDLGKPLGWNFVDANRSESEVHKDIVRLVSRMVSKMVENDS